ncbi:hypothetical protein G7Z17_g8296 [Cylindrodendrum hubeiense]|uniref:Uncharacterized protein n=1 Tax=Cylindrodendrum hubeiense TaxID=595255 RepID=A0A9P5H290_9HYPO|nr:hypothetical protein G7Z17_g8296 [Cylindrodendrum hubeiense]
MFEVDHNHHGSDFKRFFSPGRSSMTAIDDKRAEAFRRHVYTVTMIDEDPLSGMGNRHATDFVRPRHQKQRRLAVPQCLSLSSREPHHHPSTELANKKPVPALWRRFGPLAHDKLHWFDYTPTISPGGALKVPGSLALLDAKRSALCPTNTSEGF